MSLTALLLLACAAVPEPPPTSTVDPSASAPTPDAPPPLAPTLRQAATQAGLDWPPPDLSVHVAKAERQLEVRSGATVLGAWRVGLGANPAGDKEREGDQRTPTGTFTVVTRNERSRFHLFLGLSYPSTDDAAAGLADGRLTAAQARSIEHAIEAGRPPPWTTPLGGAIGLHGGGGDSDWTLGCIAVSNDQIEQLWEVAELGTPVLITE